MADEVEPAKPMPRGAYPSPRHVLAAATPFAPDLFPPPQPAFLMWPVQMSMWGNDVNGDCVTAEEAFAKAAADPQTYFPDEEVIDWARAHGVLKGANLPGVLGTMTVQGFAADFTLYNDGPALAVDWTNDTTLQSAISNSGPVKLGVGAGMLEGGATGKVTPGSSGWTMCDYPTGQGEDHCVSLCGYGSLMELFLMFKLRGVALNIVDGMPEGPCYAFFTWNSIGVVDRQSLMNMTYEAWVRTPVTVTAPQPAPAYLTTHGSDGLYTYDPVYQAWPAQVPSTVNLGFRGICQLGNTLYLVGQTNFLQFGGGLWTFDLQARTTPVLIPSTETLGFSEIVAIGTTLYMSTQGSGGIYTLDTRFPDMPPSQIAGTDGLALRSIAAVGDMLYLTTQDDGGGGVYWVNTSTAAFGQFPNTAGLRFNNILAANGILYLTAQWELGGLYQFDPSTGATPTLFPNTLGHGFLGMALQGTHLYLTTQGDNGGIWIFDTVAQAPPVQVPSSPGLGFWDIVFT